MITTIPHYTLTGELHDGIDTVVYRGYRNTDQAAVAIKLTKGEYPSLRQIGRLRHEYVLLKDLDHPCVVRAHALVSTGNGLALVTEYLDAQALSSILRTEVLDLKTFLHLGMAITEAIEAIHERQIIHKDIKPHNIMVVRGTRQVKLIDFSVATSLSQESLGAKSPDLLEGTLAYISPEQTGRMNRVVDHRADLYSLGVTMYEMLTGTVPFQTTDPLELVHSHIARSPTPLRELAPRVPEALSSIVMKLLSKGAEDRYQSARGIKMDLRECLRQLEATARVDPFALGRHDHGNGLLIPQRLYGRDVEVATLLAAWDRVNRGAAELVFISGPAGVGKSVLVNELYKTMAARRAFLIGGKFDQLNRSVPYASLAQAFRDLARQLLTERTEVLAEWKRKLLAALGPNGQVILQVIPELELIIGAQPSAPTLGPTEAQNRFNLVFQSFLRVCATVDHPLTLFLDDLQWADAASLRLIEVIMSDPAAAHLLVIGAYRSNEVQATHPFSVAHGAILKSGAKVVEIRVEPLQPSDVSEMVADTLGCDGRLSAPLAALVFEKTRGNPFFVNQFLVMLHKDQMVAFDAPSCSWTWDIERVRGAMITDNVVDLMAMKLQQLAVSTRQVLKLAACIGHRFDLKTLSTIYERSPTETAEALWEALRENVVLPLDPEYRFMHSSEDVNREGIPLADINVSYRFLHDRVQQAAYSLIEDDRKQLLHLTIGRLLLARSERGERGEDLFDVVNHMNIGAETIAEPGERLRLARMNLLVGKKAKAAAAFETAAKYFQAGLSLLGDESWEQEYELTFALHAEGAECAYLSGQFEQAEACFDRALARAESTLDRANLCTLRITLYMTVVKLPEALALARHILPLLGVALPEAEDEQMAAVMRELDRVRVNLAGRRAGDLVESPELTDPVQRAAQKLLMTLGPVILSFAPRLYPFIAARQVNISLEYGQSDLSAFGYVAYGFSLALMGQYEEACELGRLAMKLTAKWKNPDVACGVTLLFAGFISFYREPLRLTIPWLVQVVPEALEVGNFQYALYCSVLSIQARMSQGSELQATNQEIEKYLALSHRIKDAVTIAGLTVAKQTIASLRGNTKSIRTLSDERFNEPEFVEALSRGNIEFQACSYYVAKLQLAVLFEDHEAAPAMGAMAEKRRMSAGSAVFTTEIPFYSSLAILALYPSAAPEQQERYQAMLKEHELQLTTWADNCPENFRHKLVLVAAERARVAGEVTRAMELYDEAVRLARENEFTHQEALANELCAKFYMNRGRQKIARTYMADAVHGYTRWGAHAKVAQLKELHPALMVRSTEASFRATGPMEMTTLTSSAEVLDIASVVKASQAVLGEIELPRLLEKLVRIALENAGANKGYLLLENNGELYVEAATSAQANGSAVLESIPLGDVEDISQSVVRYVHKTKEPVVLANAAKESMFGFDAYVTGKRPKSILCTPIAHQGKLVGVLYLENTITEGAFTPGRLEILQILSAQAAISIENSRLYANLEEKVRERTAELRQVQVKLLRLEREATEKRMAGGFAHEIRNALAGSKLVLAKALGASGAGPSVSMALQSARELGEHYEALIARLPESELDHYTERIQRIFETQESLDATLHIVFKATNRALTITKKIMDFSRIGERAPDGHAIDVNSIIDSVLADAKPSFAGRSISIRNDGDGPVIVQGDETHYYSILQNLIYNARDAIVEKGTTGHAGVIAIKTRIDGGSCVLQVTDDGVGIREEDISRIFEAFYSTKAEAGTGLGLSVVKRIIDVCGGTIDVQSDLGMGSRFTVTLPTDGRSAWR